MMWVSIYPVVSVYLIGGAVWLLNRRERYQHGDWLHGPVPHGLDPFGVYAACRELPLAAETAMWSAIVSQVIKCMFICMMVHRAWQGRLRDAKFWLGMWALGSTAIMCIFWGHMTYCDIVMQLPSTRPGMFWGTFAMFPSNFLQALILVWTAFVDEMRLKLLLALKRHSWPVMLYFAIFWPLVRGHWTPIFIFVPFLVIELFTGVSLHFKAKKAALAAMELVAEDQRRYDNCWQEITNVCDAELGHLEQVVAQLRLRMSKSSLWSSAHRNQNECRQPTSSIDELFAVAREAHPPFQDWVGNLAAQTGAEHCAAGLKKATRTLQKVRRSYKDDASRLCDIVRASLIFNSVAEAAQCLRLIAAQDHFKPCRVKNRLDRSFDSKLSAGYRDLSLNLRWDGNGTWHICELQLQLRALYALKTDGGHKRYVQWRDNQGQ